MALPKIVYVTGACVLLACIGGCVAFLTQPESGATLQSTDDAYVKADFTLVAPQVPGRIVAVHAEDNRLVQAGDTLATIDDRDFKLAVQSAMAEADSARAAIESVLAHRAMQASVIGQAKAALAADDAALALAKADVVRYRNLATDGSGTVQALEQAEARMRIAQATREKDVAASTAAHQQLAILSADVHQARAKLGQAQAAVELAELNLSHTRIVAPVGGTIGERSARVGAYVSSGKPLLAIVPLQAIYIEANFRETQLERVRPGQPVRIRVDALPGVALSGRVESLGPASGVSFSAIAPHNATGNFTKIVQRLPVRISIDAKQAASARLRVGMSVRPEIDVRSEGSDS